jgi:hypothetical protein
VDAQVDLKVRLGRGEGAVDAADNCHKVECRWNRIHLDKNLTLGRTSCHQVNVVFIGCWREGCLVHGKDVVGREVRDSLGQVDQGHNIVDGIRIQLLGEGSWGRALLRPGGLGRWCTASSMGSVGCHCLGGRAGMGRGSRGFGGSLGCFVSRSAGGVRGLGGLIGNVVPHPGQEGAGIGDVFVWQSVPPVLTASGDKEGNCPCHVHLVPGRLPALARPVTKDLDSMGKHVEEVAGVFSLWGQNRFMHWRTSRSQHCRGSNRLGGDAAPKGRHWRGEGWSS